MQNSCSHYNAFCNQGFQSTMWLRSAETHKTHWTSTSLSSPAAATLRLPPQNKPHATFMQPLPCVLQHHAHIHAAITLRLASTRCKTPRENRLRVETIQAAPVAHRRYLSSPAAATLHGKTEGFVLRLPPQHNSHATFMQPLQSPLPKVTTLLRHHFPRSPHSLRHHFPRSPHSLREHFPRSPHSLRRHFPKSPLPFVTTYPTHHFHHPSSCTAVWCKVSQFYLSVTWKIASQLTLTIILQIRLVWISSSVGQSANPGVMFTNISLVRFIDPMHKLFRRCSLTFVAHWPLRTGQSGWGPSGDCDFKASWVLVSDHNIIRMFDA